MVDISAATYSPPGVYVSDESTPVVTPRSIDSTTVTVIGPALGYQTATQFVSVQAASGTQLEQRGVYTTAVVGPPPIAAPVVTSLAGEVYVYLTDYTFEVVAGTGGAPTAITKIKRLSGDPEDLTQPSPNGLVDGEQVRIVYAFTDATYFEPAELEDYDQIVARYGAAMVTVAPSDPLASQVASALTLAAKIALENGAASVLCVPTNPASGDFRTQFTAAYAKIAADYRARLLVPLFVDSAAYDTSTPTNVANLLSDLRLHCEGAAGEGYGRIAFTGVPTSYDNTVGHDQLAAQQSTKRLVLAYPNRLLAFNGVLNASTEIDGFYLAAAMAGRLARNPVNRGLTKQGLNSFTGLPATVQQQMTRTFRNNLSKSGVCVAEINQSSQLIVRHGLSTDMTSVLTREVSLTRIGDTLLQMVQAGMDASGLVGEPITADMTMTVKGAVTGIVEQAVADEVIVAYANVQVRQLNTDPSVIEVTFAYRPAVPLNYIVVKFSVDLSTGDTSVEESEDLTA